MDWNACSKAVMNSSNTEVGRIPTLDCIPALFSEAVYWAFLIAGSVAVVMIIWAGIKYIRSGGDQKQVQSARQTLTFGIIGLIVVLSSVFIINLVSFVTGAKCITRFGFKTCPAKNVELPWRYVGPLPQ